MRGVALLLLLAGLASSALATTRVNVEQVEQLLAASHKLSDGKLAAKIAGLELVERASSARLKRWQGEFDGKRTREALLALADASSFLDLPSEEIPARAMPDTVEMSGIFQRAIAYANTTIKKLPNFSARRTTVHFDDVTAIERLHSGYMANTSNGYREDLSPSQPPSSGGPLLREGDASSTVVTYRDGQEVADASREKGTVSAVIGMTTSGEFGPILSVVTGDAANGKVFWSHWEQGASGPLAVFRILVRQDESHFLVTGAGNMPRYPSYHGEIAVDPASGTIYRVTLASDWKPPFQPSVAAIVVEYGPVEIGAASYICPIKGVALSRVRNGDSGGRAAIPFHTFVNDVSFTEYHVFRGEVHILP